LELIMPVLPSGRRIEFSLDRFHALLGRMDGDQARRIAETLHHPDDLLPVLDAVHFALEDGRPYFADYVAADWMPCAADWSHADRQALQAWLASDAARFHRAEAIGYVKTLLLERLDGPMSYPYLIVNDIVHPGAHEGFRLRQ